MLRVFSGNEWDSWSFNMISFGCVKLLSLFCSTGIQWSVVWKCYMIMASLTYAHTCGVLYNQASVNLGVSYLCTCVTSLGWLSHCHGRVCACGVCVCMIRDIPPSSLLSLSLSLSSQKPHSMMDHKSGTRITQSLLQQVTHHKHLGCS